jgi:galactokinase/mevalonate kinase-like predicted kinase
MNLVFTGVTRNSKQILKNVTDNLDKVYPLLETVDKSYDALSENNYSQFLELINDGWQQKKSTTSKKILQSLHINCVVLVMEDSS